MHCQPGGLIHQKRKGVLIDDAQTDLRLRTNASTLGRQCKRTTLPRKDPLIGQHRPVICKKAAALELDPAGEVGRHGAPAQKIAQQHPLRPFLIRHPETQLHPRALPLSWGTAAAAEGRRRTSILAQTVYQKKPHLANAAGL